MCVLRVGSNIKPALSKCCDLWWNTAEDFLSTTAHIQGIYFHGPIQTAS